MDQSLVSVMRNINDALRLDKDCHDKEAYVKYLDCILCITCSLQQSVRDSEGEVVVNKQVTKQVKLAQQCIERVATLVDKIGSNQRPAVQKSPMEERRVIASKPKPFAAVPPLPPEPSVNTFARRRNMTPMELAYIKNQQLMTAYRARMARMNKHHPGAFNLSLTIQRKMAENMAIAQKSEMALAKKMQERQERLEEQAAKRFATPVGMSEEEQEQRQIYKKILEYEQDAKWLHEWRHKLETSPQEPEVICQLVQEILRCRDHPLTLLIKQYQHKVYEKIYPIISDKKHRLSAITVPLDKSLWPPELREDKVTEECKLGIFSKPKGSGEEEHVDEDGDTSPQKPEIASSPTNAEGDTSPQKPEIASSPTNAEGDTSPQKPEIASSPTNAEGDTSPQKPEIASSPTNAEGDTSPQKPEIASSPTNAEGDTSPQKPEIASSPTNAEGDTSPQKPEIASSPTNAEGDKTPLDEKAEDFETSGASNSVGAENSQSSEAQDTTSAENEGSGSEPKYESSDDTQLDSSAPFSPSKYPSIIISDPENTSKINEDEEETSFSYPEDTDEQQKKIHSNNSNQETGNRSEETEDISEQSKTTNVVTDSDNNNATQAQSDSEETLEPATGSVDQDLGSSDEGPDPQSLVRLAEDTKKGLFLAMEKGEHTQARLEAEQAKAVRVLRQISNDYESYNAENMDDLFDDEDGHDEGETKHTEREAKSEDPGDQPEESFKPRSPSGSSLKGPDSLISRSSSGGSVQEFPSLPSVVESKEDIQRLSREAYQRHVKNISADVHMYLEKLLVLFTIAYEQLNSPLGRDQCYASLEETFFKPLWKFLLMLFRLANYQDELSIACKMTQKLDAGPREVGVRKKLCLMPSSQAGTSPGENDVRPYQQAIAQLRGIKDHYTMLSKLECVVKVVRQVCDSVKEFHTSQGCKPEDVPSVGADDLVPVISYVVLQSRLPQLVSECHAMAEFIHEGYIMGQEGYCLTTLETAVSYIVSADLSEPFSPC